VNSMTTIEFGELPDSPRSMGVKYDHEGIVKLLQERPGEWAKCYPDAPTSLASNIRAGKVAAYVPSHRFEAVVRNSKDSRGEIWVRFIGDDYDPNTLL